MHLKKVTVQSVKIERKNKFKAKLKIVRGKIFENTLKINTHN